MFIGLSSLLVELKTIDDEIDIFDINVENNYESLLNTNNCLEFCFLTINESVDYNFFFRKSKYLHNQWCYHYHVLKKYVMNIKFSIKLLLFKNLINI